ncbi:MAG: glycoside hydrolase [Bacteroidetes bacterium]|nr:MAG: glycoside hydrolase [Bacteroidota bacterium]
MINYVKKVLAFISFLFIFIRVSSQSKLDSLLPIRGFCIAAPHPSTLDSFVNFINTELASCKVNTLVIRFDYNYQYESHPELTDTLALSKDDMKKIVQACKQNNIRIIPQINLLGHQSWANRPNKLLKAYPQFDETPQVLMPEKYVWPNSDNLYCKSYCPMHPEVHKVVFDVIDEICDVLETNAFHAGMDEVFYLGDDKCPRCAGRDKAVLFANEVTEIRNHLAEKNRELWIWGDRLLDGKETGLGMWEASFNNTHRAVDMIPKDVMICDWHYERADKTAVYFAMKGFRVITCPYRNGALAQIQVNDMINWRMQSSGEMKDRFQGMMQTVWSGVSPFLDGYFGKANPSTDGLSAWNCFTSMYYYIGKLK